MAKILSHPSWHLAIIQYDFEWKNFVHHSVEFNSLDSMTPEVRGLTCDNILKFINRLFEVFEMLTSACLIQLVHQIMLHMKSYSALFNFNQVNCLTTRNLND